MFSKNNDLETRNLVQKYYDPTVTYSIFQITTQADTSFKMIGYINEDIYDLKKRIENMESIPILDQNLFWNGEELDDSQPLSNLKDSTSLFMMIN